MSELTKEKIYKNELIKAGAEGNNNLERIRSLAGGGGNKKYKLEFVSAFVDNPAFMYEKMKPITFDESVYLFGGEKVSQYSATDNIFQFNSVVPFYEKVLGTTLSSATNLYGVVKNGNSAYVIYTNFNTRKIFVDEFVYSSSGLQKRNVLEETIQTNSNILCAVFYKNIIYAFDDNGNVHQINTPNLTVTTYNYDGIISTTGSISDAQFLKNCFILSSKIYLLFKDRRIMTLDLRSYALETLDIELPMEADHIEGCVIGNDYLFSCNSEYDFEVASEGGVYCFNVENKTIKNMLYWEGTGREDEEARYRAGCSLCNVGGDLYLTHWDSLDRNCISKIIEE